MNDTREGEGVTRELATGSITSSRVMELTSNQASEIFHAVSNRNCGAYIVSVAWLVNVVVYLVQSVVHNARFKLALCVRVPKFAWSGAENKFQVI